LGYRCNQSCLHCHVNAGPKRTEEMTAETVDAVIAFLAANPGVRSIDLTGGAPELNSQFRRLVLAARARGLRVIDRCNLTILEEPGQDSLAEFLSAHRVEIVASLPCYLEENVDRQRGNGVFEASLRALRRLNDLGYGREGSGLSLNLVYNPQGPSLPPPQAALQADYKQHLGERYGVVFNELFTLANMPIQRFGSMLISKGQFNAYLNTLRERAPRCQPRRRDVPQPGQHRLAGLPLRLRLQPATGAGHGRRRRRPPAHHPRHGDGHRRNADPGSRALLRLHRGPGVELRRRAGPRHRRGAKLRYVSGGKMNEKLNGIEACVFDAYGTLFDFNTRPRPAHATSSAPTGRSSPICGALSSCSTPGCAAWPDTMWSSGRSPATRWISPWRN
jgi:radical SAM/Cys-rich protein